MINYRLGAVIVAGVCFASASLANAQTFDPDVGSDGLNPPTGGTLYIQRLLSAPRIDPSSASHRVASHLRRYIIDPEIEGTDFREEIRLYTGSTLVIHKEGDVAPGAGGLVWGGAAYRRNAQFFNSSYQPYFSMSSSDADLNSFGGLTLNGGAVAFFAGLIADGDMSPTNRTGIPTNIVDPPDPDEPAAKPFPLARGIWSGPMANLSLRAIENSAAMPAPNDPDPSRGLQSPPRSFRRLHPSDYVPVDPLQPAQNTLMEEQRFTRVSNLAMNRYSEIAFRGDIGDTNISLGIWADQTIGGTKVLHRVFVEDLGASGQIAFLNTASNNPSPYYRIAALGAPTISDAAWPRKPWVAAYAVLRSHSGIGALGDPVTGIIARQVGKDTQNPNGYQPRIIAIEGEDFNIRGSSTTYQFVKSPRRVPDGFLGLPGLADALERDLTSPIALGRVDIKANRLAGIRFGIDNAMAYKPRVAINAYNQVAFMGRIASVDGQPVTDIEPLTGDLRDEGVYSTRGATGPGEFERIAFEGAGAGDCQRHSGSECPVLCADA